MWGKNWLPVRFRDPANCYQPSLKPQTKTQTEKDKQFNIHFLTYMDADYRRSKI